MGVGDVIADAIKVGKDGVVNVEESNTFGLDLEFTRERSYHTQLCGLALSPRECQNQA